MTEYATPIRHLLDESAIPADFITSADGLIGDLLDNLYFTNYAAIENRDGVGFVLDLVIFDEAKVGIPGVDGLIFVVGGNVDGLTTISADVFATTRGIEAGLSGIKFAIRFPPNILKPSPAEDAGATAAHSQIEVEGSIRIDENLDVHIEEFDALRLPPSVIGDSGIIIEADDVKVDLTRSGTLDEIKEAGFDDSFVGLFIGNARLRFPEGFPKLAPEDLVLRNCAIGSGGISGQLSAEYPEPVFDPDSRTFSGKGAGDLFGIPFAVTSASVRVRQNAFMESSIAGQLLLPFFDKRVQVKVSIQLDGGFTAEVTGAASGGDGFDSETGLLTLEKAGAFRLDVEALRLELKDGVLWTKLTGLFTPLIGGLSWPGFRVTELGIDPNGNVALDGGWLDLGDQYGFDFHGFRMEITKLAFGNEEDGGRWVGLSGGLKLVANLTAGASVEGLRLYWYDDGRTRVTFDGVGVELEIPDVIRFKGSVAYRDPSDGVVTNHRFDGAIELQIPALDLSVDGSIVISSVDGDTFLAVYLSAELPAGIPLWATGLSLYGVAGLFALDMEPDKRPDEEWYDGWYLRPTTGVSDIVEKWRPAADRLGLGAGVTIGTAADNGYAFSGRMLLAFVFPGPIVLIEGKANVLRERAKLAGDDPVFRALTVIDGTADTFLVNVDAHYKYNKEGRLIDIRGGAEAFFDFNDASAWHLYLGEDEPRDRRIRAQLFKLFQVEAYFMLEHRRLATGAWFGYEDDWTFGPLKVHLAAWIEADAVVSWQPTEFHGSLALHGAVGLSVWRFGTELEVEALITADVFEPYHLIGDFTVRINLPWPLSDIEKSVTVEWGPELNEPPLPLPLKDVAVEHLKVTTKWPLPRGSLLLPVYDEDGIRVDPDVPPATVAAQPAPSGTPVVPLDCRPRLTFSRPVHDDALIGVNPSVPIPEFEIVGDPEKNEGPVRVRYGLREVALHRRTNASWELVARKVGPNHPEPNPADLPELFGSWAPMPALGTGDPVTGSDPPTANTKLWLWSKNPFDVAGEGGSSWTDWFEEEYPGYPCHEPPPVRVQCLDFEDILPAAVFRSPWTSPRAPRMELSWIPEQPLHVTILDAPLDGLTKALCIVPIVTTTTLAEIRASALRIRLPKPVQGVDLVLTADGGVVAVAATAEGTTLGPFSGGTPADPTLTIAGDGIVAVLVRATTTICVARICVSEGATASELAEIDLANQRVQDAGGIWAQTGNVLQPDSIYRLTVVTSIRATGEPPLESYSEDLDQVEFTYLRTKGPPGIASLSVPIGQADADLFESGLDTLAGYVDRTVPESVPVQGEIPHSPRRPIYRAYDVEVAFNENYVEAMYRGASRDLGLYLFDNNGMPALGLRGRLLSPSSSWGTSLDLELSEQAEAWNDIVNDSDCASLDAGSAPHSSVLHDASSERVLEPDTTYEARLTPLRIHERFLEHDVGTEVFGPAAEIGEWRVEDVGTRQDPSRWIVAEDARGRFLRQTSNIWGGTQDGKDPIKPGSLFLTGDATWTNYRIHLRITPRDDDAVGVVFRYADSDHHYRFSMDRQRRYRALVRVIGGVHTVLARDEVAYRQDREYALTIDCVGEQLRVHLDNEVLFDLLDPTLDNGSVGLYVWGSRNAEFRDIQVVDLGANATVAYRFSFTTSVYVNFFHHIHSSQDEAWRVIAAESVSMIPHAAAASTASVAPTDAEAIAYETLRDALGEIPPPRRLEVITIEHDSSDAALWVRSPEPIDWDRVDFSLEERSRWQPPREPPGALKMIDFRAGEMRPNEERLSLLCRDDVDLSESELRIRSFPDVLRSQAPARVFADNFRQLQTEPSFEELFGINALDPYEIVDEGAELGPASWTVTPGAIRQSSPIFGGSLTGSVPAKPGSMAMLRDYAWRNARIDATLASTDSGAVGIVFRYVDSEHYYRFSADSTRGYRRLVKKTPTGVETLWQDSANFAPGITHAVTLLAYEGQLVGFVDEVVAFVITEDEALSGRVGYYSWHEPGASFERLRISPLLANPLLLHRGFQSLGEFTTIVAEDSEDGPPEWDIDNDGALVQLSNVFDAVDGPNVGTAALLHGPQWSDVDVSVKLRSRATGSVGVIVRYRDPKNYYRFSMDRERSFRRLVRVVDGVTETLWEDSVAYEVEREYGLTITLDGQSLSGSLDGDPLFAIRDASHAAGHAALYCWRNPGAVFTSLVVVDRARRIGRWLIDDRGEHDGPSRWVLQREALAQTSNIYGDGLPAAPGTTALAGDPSWSDYRFVVRMRSDDSDAIGIVFRYQDDQNYYRLSVDARLGYRRLVRVQGGAAVSLWESSSSYTVGSPFELAIEARGSRLIGYFDAEQLFEVVDEANTHGGVGLYSWANVGAVFEHAEVWDLSRTTRPEFEDGFEDGDMSVWTIVDEGTVAAPSSWSVVDGILHQSANIHDLPIAREPIDKRGTYVLAGDPSGKDVVIRTRLQSTDNDAIGVMFRFVDSENYYRFSMDRQRQYRRVVKCINGTFTLLWETGDGYELGRPMELTIVAIGASLRGYLDGVSMFAVQDPDLSEGAFGLYSWGNVGARFSQVSVHAAGSAYTAWALQDDFFSDVRGRWRFETISTAEPTDAWTIGSSAMAHVAGDAQTSAALTRRFEFDDVRVSVRVRRLSVEGAVGVISRHAGADGYYVFQLTQGSSRLVRRAGGETDTELWSSARGLEADRHAIVTLECNGARLRGFIDGASVFDLDDEDGPTAGAIGVFAEGDASCEFTEVHVSTPHWETYAALPAGVLHAGTGLALYPGNPRHSVEPPSDATTLFANAFGERGKLTVDDTPHLAVTRQGAIGRHERVFLPQTATPVPVRVLRNRDHTGFFVFGDPTLPTAPGEYQLRFLYRRNNRSVDPQSPILRQAGRSTAEEARLDIPIDGTPIP